MMEFASLEQRMAQTYIDLFPQFVPDDNTAVSKAGQKDFYDLMKNLYALAFSEPLLFVPALHEDDVYPRRFNKKSYGKPELEKNMKKFTKAVDDLLQNMYLAGRGSGVKFSKKQIEILARLKIENCENLPAAWKWMAGRPGADIINFSHCFFKKDHPYTSGIFAPLIGEAAFKKLEKQLVKMNYRRFDVYGTTASSSPFTLIYANPAWGGEDPKGFLFKVKQTGIAISYEPNVKNPQVLGLCIPGGLKPYLGNFDAMDNELKNFVIAKTKKCDNCRYCVQTDKTGTRPLAAINVCHENKNYSLCPYFPGFSYCWTAIDDTLADRLLSMLLFMDRFANTRTC